MFGFIYVHIYKNDSELQYNSTIPSDFLQIQREGESFWGVISINSHVCFMTVLLRSYTGQNVLCNTVYCKSFPSCVQVRSLTLITNSVPYNNCLCTGTGINDLHTLKWTGNVRETLPPLCEM